MNFVIQERAIMQRIWFEPDQRFMNATRGSSVSVLRDAINAYADQTTLSFAQHFRIVTRDGAPVTRFVVRPGRVKETRRRY